MKKILLALLAAALLASGCNSNGRAQNTTDLRALNALVDGENVDVLVDDDVKLGNVAPNSVTAYTTFSAGSRGVKVRTTSGGTVLVDGSQALGNAIRNTLIIHGRKAAAGAYLLPEDTAKPDNSRARVRAANLSPDSGPVDLYLASSATTDGTAVTTATEYPASSAFASVAPGSYTVVFKAAGTEEVLFRSTGTITVAGGGSYTVIAMPSGGGRLVNGFFLEQGEGGGTYLANASGRVKVVNAVGGMSFNVKVDGATAITNVAYASASGYVATSGSGTRTITAEPTNVPGSPFATTTLATSAARDYTLLLAMTATGARFVTLPDDNSTPAAGFAKVRFVNALSDGTSVDALLNGTSQATGIAPLAATGYSSITAITTPTGTITFTAAGGGTTIASIANVQLDAGNVYTAYVFGTAGAATAALVRDR